MARVQTDPNMLVLEKELERLIEAGLDEAAEQLRREIESYGRTLTAADTDKLLRKSTVILTALFVTMAVHTRNTQRAIAQSQVDKNQPVDLNLLLRAGAPLAYRRSFEAILQAYPEHVYRTFYTRKHPADLVSYQHRIKTVRDSTERTVRNIIRNGNRNGQSVAVMSRKVQNYLKPSAGGRKVEPLNEARQASRVAKPKKPRGVRSGSVHYNAIRIARTESAETYRAAHSQMYEGTIFEGGEYDWLLSNSHANPDHCDDLARQSPYKANQRPHSHPNCLCTWSKRPPSLADVERLLRERGVIQ